MVNVAAEKLEKAADRPRGRGRRRRLAAAIVVGLGIGGLVLLASVWPFTQAKVIEELERATSSRVQIAHFSRTFFPRPGCVAEGVEFRRGSDPRTQAILTVKRLAIAGNFSGLFTKHLALIRADGAHAIFPPFGQGPDWKPTPSV